MRLATLVLLLLLPLPAVAFPGQPSPSSSWSSPFRWTSSKRGPTSAAQATPAAAPARPSAARPALVPAGGPCQSDDDCVDGTFCNANRCERVVRAFNALYLYYRSGDRRFTEVLGVYWHRRGDEGYRVVFPFYWSLWSPEEQHRVVFPFTYQYEDRREQISSTLALLFQYRRTPREKNYRLWPVFFWTDYGERGSGITLFPLFHRAREGTRTSTVLPFLLSGYNTDPAEQRSQGLIAGVVYWKTDHDFRARALFPFFYRSSAPGRSRTWVFPLNFYSRQDDHRSLWILPLAYHGRSPGSSTTLSLVPPFGYHHDPGKSWLYALPLFYHRRTGDESFSTLFPIYWRFSSPERGFQLAGPVFYRRRGAKLSVGLFPLALYHRDRDRGERMAFVLPLFYHDSADHHLRSRILSPVFLYERDRDAQLTHWGLVAPPFYSRRDAEREVDVLFPLGLRWHNKTDRSTTWVLGPLVLSSDPEGGSQTLLPLFWRFKDAKSGSTTSIFFPVFYRQRRPDGGHFNLLLPFYYASSRRGTSGGVLPLLHVGWSPERRHAVLFPVIWHLKRGERSTTVVGPIYHDRDRGGWNAGIAPVFFAGRRGGDSYQVLFPAFWHLRSTRDGFETLVLGSFFWTRGRKGQAVGLLPLFAAGTWKGRSFQTVLPPLYYRSVDPVSGDGTTLAGLYYGWRSGDDHGSAVFPVFYHRRTGKEQRTALLPLFYYRQRPDDQLLITPVGGFRKDSRTGTVEGLIGPYAFHRSKTARGFAVIPALIHWTRPEKQSTTTVILPLGVRHVSPEQQALVWFPLFWKLADREQRSLVVFPIFWHQRQTDGTATDVVFPLYWRIRTAKRHLQVAGPIVYHRAGNHVTGAVAPLAIYRRDEESSYLFALPFFYYGNRFGEATRTWAAGPIYYRSYRRGEAAGLFPLFFHKWTPESSYTILAPIFWRRTVAADQYSLTVAGTAFYRRRGEARDAGLLPLGFASWGRGQRRLAVVPLFYHQRSVESRTFYTLLGGASRSPEASLWYAGPYLRRRSATTALDLFLPLVLRHRDHQRAQTTLLALPFYYGRWSPERAFHLAFPLVWRYRRVDRSATVVFPVVWDFNDRFTSRTTMVFPLFLRHRNHEADTTSYVAPAVWLRKRPSATEAVVFPILWHFGGAERSTTVAFPLYWDFKRPSGRTTLALPLYARVDRPSYRSHVVLNTYYRRDKQGDGYRFIFIPLFEVQRKRPGDLQVEVLGGLVGYERVGRNRLLTLFFYTFALEPTSGKTLSGFGGTRQQASVGAW